MAGFVDYLRMTLGWWSAGRRPKFPRSATFGRPTTTATFTRSPSHGTFARNATGGTFARNPSDGTLRRGTTGGTFTRPE